MKKAFEDYKEMVINPQFKWIKRHSYKVTEQACGRIDRLNTPYRNLYFYHIKSRSGIDMAITKALNKKKKFNERKFAGWDSQ